ncbi:MAG: exodeoxyribonuclease III [Puniceicoccales bacterium]|jgi:exodeoxyribonuclease-3|nr:exodeoxyribonuclease III [Puniceicoccales bacterium]
MPEDTARPLKLFSWNVNGFRSVAAKTFDSFLGEHSPDILCLQEIKMNMPPCGDLAVPYPHQFWHSAERPGYSGTAILSRVKPLAVTTDFATGAEAAAAGGHPKEGRVITAEFAGCYVVCTYSPNSKDGLARLDYRLRWERDFQDALVVLAEKKPVFVCGDLNVAHTEIDLENPERNHKSAGFSDEERASFSALLARGFADTFREKNPAARQRYTWWSYRSRARERNVGWRIDYWLASLAAAGKWDAPAIHPDTGGSDHCPVSIEVVRDLFGSSLL